MTLTPTNKFPNSNYNLWKILTNYGNLVTYLGNNVYHQIGRGPGDQRQKRRNPTSQSWCKSSGTAIRCQIHSRESCIPWLWLSDPTVRNSVWRASHWEFQSTPASFALPETHSTLLPASSPRSSVAFRAAFLASFLSVSLGLASWRDYRWNWKGEQKKVYMWKSGSEYVSPTA